MGLGTTGAEGEERRRQTRKEEKRHGETLCGTACNGLKL
jgi:hypothetical protein